MLRQRGSLRGPSSEFKKKPSRNTKKFSHKTDKDSVKARPPNRPNPFRKVRVDTGFDGDILGSGVKIIEVSAEKEEWHNSTQVREKLEEFHKMFASPRSAVVKLEKSNHYQELCEKLGETLIKQRKECIRLEFTGSYYEETKVDDGLEFDIMLIIDGSNLVPEPVEGHSGFVHLKPKVNSRVKGAKDKINRKHLDKGNLSSKLLANKFQGMLESCMNGLEGVSFKKHGPAVQMDVMQLESELENAASDIATSYQVDLVPAYQIPDPEHPGKNTYYVAKPIKEERMPSTSAWRQSFSIQEKKQFQEVDKNDEGNRRMCLRILKALCKRDAPLNKLNSYHLKSIMFHDWDEHPEKEWSRDYLGERIMDTLGRLEIALAVQYLPHFYIGKKLNLFEDFKGQRKKLNCENMLGRVRRLRVSKEAFLKCINVQPKKKQKMGPRKTTRDEREFNKTST